MTAFCGGGVVSNAFVPMLLAISMLLLFPLNSEASEQVRYFEWLSDENGNPIFKENEKENLNEENALFEYHYDNEKLENVYDNQAETEEIVEETVKGRKPFYGGALKIHKDETIDINNSLFINNKSEKQGEDINLFGGALFNAGTVENVVADFIGNSVTSDSNYSSYAYGGAIFNRGEIGNITGDFIGNIAFSNNHHPQNTSFASGGAIYNDLYGTIGDITGNFIGNSAVYASHYNSTGGAIANNGGKIGNIKGDFVNNLVSGHGGAIYNTGEISDLTGNFTGNSAISSLEAFGGAISNNSKIGNIVGDFTDNCAHSALDAKGGAIWNYGSTGKITSDFKSNAAMSEYLNAYGGALYNASNVESIQNSNFYDNHADSTSGTAHGGAIYTTSELSIIADADTSTFRGNYVQVGEDEKDYQAIWVDKQAKLHFVSSNGGSINMYDNINGSNGYTVDITGDGTGTMNLYNDIYNANVQLGNTHLNTINNDIHEYHFNNFALTDNATMSVDVDLANETMDRITADIYGIDIPQPESLDSNSANNYGIHNGDLIM